MHSTCLRQRVGLVAGGAVEALGLEVDVLHVPRALAALGERPARLRERAEGRLEQGVHQLRGWVGGCGGVNGRSIQ